ncbi:MAG: hypothetical protein JWM36_1164 [Hyphomicrobiales bacterium]|nr:hypothetical protein [Hyphomicrobiales bacterium]
MHTHAQTPTGKFKATNAADTRRLVIVLFGQDARGKAHASVFCENDAALAKKAALLMGFSCWQAPAEHRDLVAKLPKGRLFASGRAFVPFVSAKALERIEAASGRQGPATSLTIAARGATGIAGAGLVEIAAGTPASGLPATAAGAGVPKAPMGAGGRPALPPDWGAIAAGNLVLATTGELADGWFECRVIAITTDGLLELEWRDFPDDPRILRIREQVALMHPESMQA